MKTFEEHIKSSLTYKICAEKCKYFAMMVAAREDPNRDQLFYQIYDEHCEGCIVQEIENGKMLEPGTKVVS